MSAVLEPPTKPKVAPSFPSFCKRTIIGLTIERDNLTFDEWQKAFEAADANERGHQWWIGDALNEGERRFGDDVFQVIDPDEEERRANEGKEETYRHYQQVAYRIPFRRRRQNLYFGHHQAVAYLEEEEQDYWLDLAIDESWSVAKLRSKIKKARDGGSEGDPALDLQVLQDPLIRQWLEDYRSLITKHDDALPDVPGAKFLSVMMRSHSEHVTRQLERTLATDCGWVKTALGMMVTAAEKTVARMMRNRGFFMSLADLKDRLKLLMDLEEVSEDKAETERVAKARGVTETHYKRIWKPGERKRFDVAAEDPESDQLLWI